MHDDETVPESAAGSAAAPDAEPQQRPFDEPPRASRGPLIFGIVAATVQMGALIWLAQCR